MHVGMIRTQIQLDGKDYERLRRRAVARGWSISRMVRESVKRTLEEEEREEGRQAESALAGKYGSGCGDLARNHDTYLADGW